MYEFILINLLLDLMFDVIRPVRRRKVSISQLQLDLLAKTFCETDAQIDPDLFGLEFCTREEPPSSLPRPPSIYSIRPS